MVTDGFLGRDTTAAGKLLCAVPHKHRGCWRGRQVKPACRGEAIQAALGSAEWGEWPVLCPSTAPGWWPVPCGVAAAIGSAG